MEVSELDKQNDSQHESHSHIHSTGQKEETPNLKSKPSAISSPFSHRITLGNVPTGLSQSRAQRFEIIAFDNFRRLFRKLNKVLEQYQKSNLTIWHFLRTNTSRSDLIIYSGVVLHILILIALFITTLVLQIPLVHNGYNLIIEATFISILFILHLFREINVAFKEVHFN
jgi:hypothetical protein